MYEVLNKGWDSMKTESEALELLKGAAEELYTFTLLAPWEESKIRLIKRFDDLQGDLDINIRPFDNKTNLRLVTRDGEVFALVYCKTGGQILGYAQKIGRNWGLMIEDG